MTKRSFKEWWDGPLPVRHQRAWVFMVVLFYAAMAFSFVFPKIAGIVK